MKSQIFDHHGGISHEVVARVAELGAEATEAVTDAAEQAGKQLHSVAVRAEKIARKYPWAAAGAVFGIGVVLGALAHRLLGHRPTVTELLGVDELPSRARRAASRYF